MGWQMDTSDHEGEEFDVAAEGNFKNVYEPGRYHTQIIGIDEAGGNSGSELVIDHEVLGGRPPGQEGRTIRDYFSGSMKARSRLLKFAYAIGATTIEEVRQAKEANRPADIDFASCEGRQLVVDATEDEYKGEKRIKIGFGIFSVSDPQVQDCLNKSMLLSASGNDGADNPFGGSQSQDSQAESQPAPSSPAGGTAAKSGLGGLF